MQLKRFTRILKCSFFNKILGLFVLFLWFLQALLTEKTQVALKMRNDLSRYVAEFIDPWLGDKVNSGIGLS
jgi:hypothetical protein